MSQSTGKGSVGSSVLSFGVTLSIILAWYTANILTLLGNKYLLANSGFKQPVFLTLCHMLACVFMGLIVSLTGWMPLKPIRSKAQFIKVCALAAIFCGTIVLGNASLRFIPVSFNQAIGATTPFYTAAFAFFMQGARENFFTYASLVPVIGGVVIASGGEPLFHALGFTFCMLATAGRALKTVVQSMLMTDPAEKLDPMSLLMYMSSVSVAILIVLTVMLEPNAISLAIHLHHSNSSFLVGLLVNSGLAYLTNLLNFLVTKYTSALTMQVLGNAKGVVAAAVSVQVFGNHVTFQGMLGYGVTVAGVFAYSESKRRAKAEKERIAEAVEAYNKPSPSIKDTDWKGAAATTATHTPPISFREYGGQQHQSQV